VSCDHATGAFDPGAFDPITFDAAAANYVDQTLLTELQYALLESPDGGQTWPSEAWTRAEVLDAVNGNVQTLLRETHLVVTRTELAVLAAGLGLVALPTDWMATATLVWRTAGGVRTPLGPTDTFEADLALPTWEDTPATPLAYADLDGDTLTLRLVPRPDADGILEILYVARPTPIDGNGTPVAVPDEFLSGIKYGSLGWLLRKVGRLHDPERAKYCEDRYDLTRTVAEIILGGWS